MSQILLLILVFIWMAGPPSGTDKAAASTAGPLLALFFSVYAVLVLMLGLWARLLARRVAADNFHRSVRWFNQVMFGARLMVPIWFTMGVWVMGWGALISLLGEGMYRSVAGLLVGTMPAFATWMGLWWSQYPAERALREQNLLIDLENDLPLYRPPAFRDYFFTKFRLQILFTLVPVAMIVLLRDAIVWISLTSAGRTYGSEGMILETVASLAAAGSVFLFVPALLTRLLNTTPMPSSPLRKRLDLMCQRSGVSYRHILVWNTNNHVGNAAVMGVLPWLRYVLLSDVLLERMSDEEIEAVFAHELGHVVHRHMTWYAIFFLLVTLVGAATVSIVKNDGLVAVLSTAGFPMMLLLFGFLSRRCERQADVYAARTMELLKLERMSAAQNAIAVDSQNDENLAVSVRKPDETPVGHHGAYQFATALRRVASINNIPVNSRNKPDSGVWNHIAYHADGLFDLANNYLHGSILSRMKYVHNLSADPQRTQQFDRAMFWLYSSIVACLAISVLLLAIVGVA